MNSAAHFSLSSTPASSSPTSPTSSTFSCSRAGPHGLPLPPVPSGPSRAPAGKRSLRNLLSFASTSSTKKQSKAATASAAKTTRSYHDDDLDFGCSGLQDDEAEDLVLADEVDMMLELQGYQDGTKGTKHAMQQARQAQSSSQPRNGRDRSGSRTAVDIPGNRFAGLNIQYTRPTIDTSRRITKVSVMSLLFPVPPSSRKQGGVRPELIPASSRLPPHFPRSADTSSFTARHKRS